jgi:drug/metabolite transporter (DMT)-like permease
MLMIGCLFASNHIAARFAFDDGLSINTAVLMRSFATASCVFLLIKLFKVPLNIGKAQIGRGIIIGLIIALQSYCLYSAVARIPVGLALLVFNMFPLCLAIMTWALGGDQPKPRTWIAMLLALAGLLLALDVLAKLGSLANLAERWEDIGSGVLFALAAALCFATGLFLTTRWMGGVDGRVRSLLSMATVTAIVLAAGIATTGFHFPRSGPGWLCLALLCALYGSAFTALFVVLPRLGAANNAVLMNIEPIAALVLGFFILGQTVSPTQMLGAAIVMGAIVYQSFQR